MKILKGGYAGQNKDSFPFSSTEGQGCYLLHLIRSHGEYQIDGISYEMKEGDCIVIQPGTPYQYHTLDAHFPDDWICFETEEKAPLPSVLTCNLPLRLEHFDRCASLIWQILMENTSSDFTPPHKIPCGRIISKLFFSCSKITWLRPPVH